MTGARAWLGWIALALIVAAATHVATIAMVPHLVMERLLARVGAPNRMHFAPRVTAASRGVVRPAPELLYSTCPFDLSKGPLRVSAPVPHTAYWSVALYDANTNNFFVENDRQANGRVDFTVLPPDDHSPPRNTRAIVSPSMQGLVLFRTLIDREKNFAALDKARRQATCETAASSGGASSSGG